MLISHFLYNSIKNFILQTNRILNGSYNSKRILPDNQQLFNIVQPHHYGEVLVGRWNICQNMQLMI